MTIKKENKNFNNDAGIADNHNSNDNIKDDSTQVILSDAANSDPLLQPPVVEEVYNKLFGKELTISYAKEQSLVSGEVVIDIDLL